MSSPIQNFFSEAQLADLIDHPNVISAKDALEYLVSNGRSIVSFKIPLTESTRHTLTTHFGIDLSSVNEIPMRWIKGDSAPHIDSGSSNFENTYLVYLNDSPGVFCIGEESYDIRSNTAYVFNEGIAHKTEGTGTHARLLLGPMNEFAEPVGGTIYILYYSNYADALNDTNVIASSGSYIVGNVVYGSIGSYTSWRIAAADGLVPLPTGVYANGFDLSTIASTPYRLYPAAPCFLEGTQVLCSVNNVETYLPIESLRPGVLVKTSRDGYKKVELIGKGEINNPGNTDRIEDRLYKCSPEVYPELNTPLYITGCHSILVDTLTDDQREKTIKSIGKIFVTDKKYRLIASVDERAEPWASEGLYTIWHLALEHDNPGMNYGIYVNGGLLVETCCLITLQNKSNMNFI